MYSLNYNFIRFSYILIYLVTYPKHLHFALVFFPPMTFKDDTHTLLTADYTFT